MNDTHRRLDFVDRLVIDLDRGLRTVFGDAPPASRPNPAMRAGRTDLGDAERREAAALMRINHAGEVAAQALYHGQALTARDDGMRESLRHAAEEENDHVVWCRERLDALGDRPSLLDPVWYAGSFAIGALAGLAGDRTSLGFLAETERQVVEHLDGHLQALPPGDGESRAILEQMREDEAKHATAAIAGGGGTLPGPVRRAMRLAARVMTGAARWL